MREDKIIEQIKREIDNNKIILNKFIYLYNIKNVNSKGNYIIINIDNKNVITLGYANILTLNDGRNLKNFLLILKKFKFKLAVIDIKNCHLNVFERHLKTESLLIKNYISTNNSRMTLIHIDLKKI